MANTKTARKMILVHEKRRVRNVSVRTRIKHSFRTALSAIASGVDAKEVDEAARQAVSAIDSAVSKGIVHKNKAARRKSRLAKKLNAASATKA